MTASVPTVRLGDVCRLAGDLQLDVSVTERPLRRGPYPHYTENCASVGLDDYAIEAGGTVMLPAYGQIVTPSGALIARLEEGRCSAGRAVHALVPHDPRDARYLWRVLTTSPKAIRAVEGTSMVRMLSVPALLALPVPWPSRAVREAYVAALDELDARLQANVPNDRGALAESVAEERRALVAAFFETGCLPGAAAPDACEHTLAELSEPRGSSLVAERAKGLAAERSAARAQRAAAAPGLVLEDNARVALGPLAPLLEEAAFGLAPIDAAWELAPLAVVRACADAAHWQAVANAAASAPGELVAALDAAMDHLAATDDLLSFLPNLSYASSLLTPEQLALWVRRLTELDPAALDGSHIRAVFALEPGAEPMPYAVTDLLERTVRMLLSTLPPDFETAYVASAATEGAVDLFARVLPNVTLRAQFDDFAPMLAAALVRAVYLREQHETRGGLGSSAGSALVHDEFPDWQAPLVVAVLPPNPGPWADCSPNPADPRWLLGTPPRNRANYAWLQHALAHQAEGGATLVVACNAALHGDAGCEPALRRALVEQGRVRAVVALPPRIFADDRPPMSLLVLGDPRPAEYAASCLMVNALDLGEPLPGAYPEDYPQRICPPAVVDRIARVLVAHVAAPDVAVLAEPGFARTVTRSELLERDALLTPWAYV